jgi:hypothetical protein
VDPELVRWLMVQGNEDLTTIDDLFGRPSWQRYRACGGEDIETFDPSFAVTSLKRVSRIGREYRAGGRATRASRGWQSGDEVFVLPGTNRVRSFQNSTLFVEVAFPWTAAFMDELVQRHLSFIPLLGFPAEVL